MNGTMSRQQAEKQEKKKDMALIEVHQ
jgi:hypothetical protein